MPKANATDAKDELVVFIVRRETKCSECKLEIHRGDCVLTPPASRA